MSDEFYLNCLDLCLSYSRELEVCLSETGRSRAVDDLENRSQEGVELMDLDGTIEEAKMRNAIRSVCDALKDAIDSAVAQEQDFTMLREAHLRGRRRGCEDAEGGPSLRSRDDETGTGGLHRIRATRVEIDPCLGGGSVTRPGASRICCQRYIVHGKARCLCSA